MPVSNQSRLFLQSDPGSLWPAATCIFFTLFLQEFSIILPPSPSFSHCCNPLLERPDAPLLCAMQVSQNKKSLFSYHHLLGFLQLPRCFPRGTFVCPLSSFACWKWPRWVSGRVLAFIFLSPWSHFIAKISSPLPIFFPHTPNKLNKSLLLQNLHFWHFSI